MFATWCASTVAIECAVRIQIVSFEVTVDSFAAGTGGATPRCGLDHDQRGFFLLGHFRRREPGLLQRGILAEQRFLQRSSHTLSLQTLKFLAPPMWPSIAAVLSRARPVTFHFAIRRNWQSCNVTRSPEVRAMRLTREPASLQRRPGHCQPCWS